MNDEEATIVISSVTIAGPVKTCPKCGQTSSGPALGGLCEGCLMRVGLGLGTLNSNGNGAVTQDISALFEDLDGDNNRLPREFGEYELLEEIAIGGMGVIYKAKHLGLGRIVALKMIKAGELARRDDVRRFKTEAEAAAKLRHPNIVTIHDIGEEDGLPFFSMTYVGGPNLSQLVRMQPLAARRAATLLRKIAMAVQHAHDEGLLHRDLKPANILIEPGDEPQVTDFGLARAIHSDSSLTRSGAILGSPSYMSPEQAEGRVKDVSVRTDIYALGAVLYEMVTGRPPFQGESAMHTMRLVCQATAAAPRLLNPDVPKDLETVCLRCLEKQPSRRYGTAREVAEEMDAFLEGRPIKARPVGPAGRLLRWCRRQPALAALSGALILVCVGGVIGMALGWGEARSKARDEIAARHAAEAGERSASQAVYNADMTLANLAAIESDSGRLIALLDRHDPTLHPQVRDWRSWEWFYLKQQTPGDELFVLGDHKSQVMAVAVSPDSRWAASTDRLGMLRIWDLEKRTQVAESRLGTNAASHLAFSPDGAWLAAAWEKGQSSLWRTGRWQEPASAWQRSSSASLVFSANSRFFYQTSRDNLKAYPLPQDDMPPGPPETLFTMPPSWWVLPLYDPEHRRTVLFDGALRFWDGARQEFAGEPWKISSPDGYAVMLKREPNGKRLAGFFNDESVHVFDAETLKSLLRLKGHRGPVFDAAFSPDGSLLATAGNDQSVQIWNLETGERVRRLSGHRGTVQAVAFFPDGGSVLSGSRDGTVRAWTAKPPPPPEGRFKRSGASASISGDSQMLLEVHEKVRTTVRSIPSGNTVAALDSTDVRDSALAPGARLGRLRQDGFIEVHELQESEYVRTDELDAGATGIDDNVSFSPDGKVLLLLLDAAAVIYDTAPLRERARFQWPASIGGTRCQAFSFDSRRVALSHFDASVTVWDLASGARLHTLRADDGDHPGLAFSPDGRLLACSSFFSGASVWDLSVSPPKIILTTTPHDVSWSVAFTPDNRRLVVGLDIGEISFWDLESGSLVMQFKSQGVPAVHISFDPRDHAMITMSSNAVIRRPVAPGFLTPAPQ